MTSATCTRCGNADDVMPFGRGGPLMCHGCALAQNASSSTNGASAAAPADDLPAWLTSALGLDAIGLRVVEAQVFGRGTSAAVDIRLSSELPNRLRTIRFTRFGDVTQPAKLMSELVTQTSVYRKINGQEAAQIAAAIVRLANHRAEEAEDEAATEWGSEFLRLAPTLEADLSDQGDRWRAFSALARMNPAKDAGEDRSAHGYAACATVLVDRESGARYVRAGWFQTFVKREVGSMFSPQSLTAQMERAGWTRPNSQGKIKATPLAVGRPLIFRFYIAPKDWPVDGLPQVTFHTREAAPHARVYREPAVTGNPEDEELAEVPNASRPATATSTRGSSEEPLPRAVPRLRTAASAVPCRPAEALHRLPQAPPAAT
jgi:hypothetical protein